MSIFVFPDASNEAGYVSSLPSQSFFSDHGSTQSADPRSVMPMSQSAALLGIDLDVKQSKPRVHNITVSV